MITPEELTGEMVKTIRTKHKITREAFKDRCVQGGLNWGKSVARLCNIEAKNSWKAGDREVVAQVINALEGDASIDWSSQLNVPHVSGPTGVDDPSNVDNPDEPSGQSNVDSRGNETRSARQSEEAERFVDFERQLEAGELPPPPVLPPEIRDPGDPFAANQRFTNEVRSMYGARHDAADALPPVPLWCAEDEDEDADLITVEPVQGLSLNVAPYTQNDNGTVVIGEPVGWNFTLPDVTDLPELPPATLNGTATIELGENDVTLIDLLESDVDTNVFNVSNSLVQTAKRCKRKWWLGWYRGLTPRHENLLDTRSTGTRVHRALQAFYVPDGVTPTDPRDALERVLVEDWTRIKTAAEARGHDEFVIGDLSSKFEKSASLERAMVEGYVEWLQMSGADSQLKIVGAEQAMSVHLYDHVRADGEVTPVNAIGLLDVRAYRTSDGAKLFMDHKTVGSLKDPVALLPMNEQMLHYHLLEWLSTPDGEERCDGALYNMLRRVKRTATARPPFYDRYEVRHNVDELETYRRRLIAETRDILHMVERLDAGADPMDVAYPTPSKNCTWDCDFFSICTMFDDGSHVEAAIDSLYVQVDPNARYEPTKGNE